MIYDEKIFPRLHAGLGDGKQTVTPFGRRTVLCKLRGGLAWVAALALLAAIGPVGAACLPPPTETVSGSTTIYPGNSATITLSSSLGGVTYQLYSNGIAVSGGATAGTGSALTWIVSPAATTTYTMETVAAGGYCAATMSGSAVVTVTGTNIPTPPAIAGLGYSLVWDDEFNDGLNSIDLNNTGAAGYKWYVQIAELGTSPASDFTNLEPSGLRILTGGNANAQLQSSYSMNVGENIAGSDGFYIESRIRYPTQTDLSEGWPAFWLRAAEQCYGTAQWPTQTAGYENFTEIDIMEYDVTYAGLNTYGGAVLNWYGIWNPTNGYQDVRGTNPTVINYPDGNNPDKIWHTYGCLVVPSTQTTNGLGYIQMFIDNVATADISYWTSPTNLGTPPPSGTHIYSTIESQHHPIVLGTGINWPMDVDWVRVWQPVGMTDASVQTNTFGFNIYDYHSTNVVEACTNLANPVWQPLQTNSMINSPIYFSDPTWTNYPGRFYRLDWP